MAEKGQFGTIIPRMSDIVEINGDMLIDKDGDEFATDLVKFSRKFGGTLELLDPNECTIESDKPAPPRK